MLQKMLMKVNGKRQRGGSGAERGRRVRRGKLNVGRSGESEWRLAVWGQSLGHARDLGRGKALEGLWGLL